MNLDYVIVSIDDILIIQRDDEQNKTHLQKMENSLGLLQKHYLKLFERVILCEGKD